MRVVSLTIENFRGIKRGTVRFRQHSVLVGANNTGKSTIVEALTLLLGRDKLIRELTEHDFFGSDPQPQDRMKLLGTIAGFAGDDPYPHSEWFRDGRAVPKWLDNKTGEVHPAKTNNEWELCCQVAVQAYFDRESLSVEMFRYFHDHENPIDPFTADSPIPVPGKLIQEMGFFLVRANRSWDKVLSWGSELFRRTIQVAAAQPSDAILAQRDLLRYPDKPIENDEHLAPLIANVNKELSRCIANSPQLQLRLTNTDSKSVLEAVSAHFSIPGMPSLPAVRHGSGLISLQGLMLLIELGRVRTETGNGFVMALEEPEIHVSPSTQHQLVHRVQALSTQTFITTHSPSVAALAEPTSVLLLRNVEGVLTAEPFLISPLTAAAPAWERKFFQQQRNEVISCLMHPCVLVPEGRADYYLLRTILRPLILLGGWDSSLDHHFGLEVGIVPTEDAKVLETYQALSRMHGSVVCLVDGDAPGVAYGDAALALALPPKAIIRWHDGAVLEDIVGWILESDSADALGKLDMLQTPPPQTIDDVVTYLKQHKVDIVAYETIADVIANNESCRLKASELYSGIAAACKGVASARFQLSDRGIWVFQP